MTPRVRSYVRDIAFWHGIPASAILSSNIKKPVALARGDVMRRLRREGFSTTQIGHWLKRDHSTVVYWTAAGKKSRCITLCRTGGTTSTRSTGTGIYLPESGGA